jgi:hypothetical protein
VVPDSRVRAICANHEVEINLDLAGTPLTRTAIFLHFEPGFVSSEVGACEFVIEEECDIWHLCQNVKKPLVEATTVDCEDVL